MTKNNNKIGIMGGTFDPVHFGHLIVAEAAKEEFNLQKVLFIPTGAPPHKVVSGISPASDRISMLQLATQTNPFFEISMIETDREGTTYTYETLLLLNSQYPTEYDWYYIIGGDTLLELSSWKQFDMISSMCSFIVYQRPSVQMGDVYKEATRLYNTLNTKIFYVEGPTMDISSKEIRQRVEKDKSVRYLLPDKVGQYINRHHLYKGGESLVPRG